MNYTPEQKNKYVTPIVVTLIAAGLGVYLVPALFPVRAVFFQIPALICIVAAVFILVRYKTTTFTYTVRPRSMMHDDLEEEAALAGAPLSISHMDPRFLDFVVSKKQGSRDGNMECVLGMDALLDAWDIAPDAAFKTCGEAMEKVRKTYVSADLYEYTVTMGCSHSLLLLFRDGEKIAAIRIEPDAGMRGYLISTAEKNKKRSEEKE